MAISSLYSTGRTCISSRILSEVLVMQSKGSKDVKAPILLSEGVVNEESKVGI